MKILIIALSTFALISFSEGDSTFSETTKTEIDIGSSFSLINDTKDKVSIYTGTGFVSLNRGSRTSIGCNIGKEVRWANSGKKGDVIFKIESKHCGKTIKLSEVIN